MDRILLLMELSDKVSKFLHGILSSKYDFRNPRPCHKFSDIKISLNRILLYATLFHRNIFILCQYHISCIILSDKVLNIHGVNNWATCCMFINSYIVIFVTTDKAHALCPCHRSISLALIFHRVGMIPGDITHHICCVCIYHYVSYHNTLHKNVAILMEKTQVHHIYHNNINIVVVNSQHMRSCSWDRSMWRKPLISWLPS